MQKGRKIVKEKEGRRPKIRLAFSFNWVVWNLHISSQAVHQPGVQMVLRLLDLFNAGGFQERRKKTNLDVFSLPPSCLTTEFFPERFSFLAPRSGEKHNGGSDLWRRPLPPRPRQLSLHSEHSSCSVQLMMQEKLKFIWAICDLEEVVIWQGPRGKRSWSNCCCIILHFPLPRTVSVLEARQGLSSNECCNAANCSIDQKGASQGWTTRSQLESSFLIPRTLTSHKIIFYFS